MGQKLDFLCDFTISILVSISRLSFSPKRGGIFKFARPPNFPRDLATCGVFKMAGGVIHLGEKFILCQSFHLLID